MKLCFGVLWNYVLLISCCFLGNEIGACWNVGCRKRWRSCQHGWKWVSTFLGRMGLNVFLCFCFYCCLVNHLRNTINNGFTRWAHSFSSCGTVWGKTTRRFALKCRWESTLGSNLSQFQDHGQLSLSRDQNKSNIILDPDKNRKATVSISFQTLK